jgi:hypothetical protein
MDLEALIEETINGMWQASRNPEWQAEGKVWKTESAAYYWGGR